MGGHSHLGNSIRDYGLECPLFEVATNSKEIKIQGEMIPQCKPAVTEGHVLNGLPSYSNRLVPTCNGESRKQPRLKSNMVTLF